MPDAGRRPLIGVLLDENPAPRADGGDFSRRPYYALRKDYFDAIARAGGLPIGIPYVEASLEAYLTTCDGFLLPGGDYRFFGDWYAAPPGPQVRLEDDNPRRRFEALLAARILEHDAPVLGVCQGMQTLAGVRGSKMVWGVDGNADARGAVRHAARDGAPVAHDIEISGDGVLHELWGAGRFAANSAHVEAVVEPGPGVRVTARAPDGVVEAIEIDGRRFAVGVQWHPELMLDDRRQLALFEALIAAAKG